MTFVIAASLLLLLVLALLAWSLWRHPHAPSRENLHGRLETELAGDVAAGTLPAGDLTAAAHDLDTGSAEETAAAQDRRGGRWVWALLVLVPVVAGVLYWQTGNWRAAIHGERVAVMHRADTMLAQLQAHLAAHPEDRSGWITLGRAQSALGDYTAAAEAYRRAVGLDPEQTPALLARWGEALVLADSQHPTAQERAIFSAVLEDDPDSIRGLWYGGLLALDAGRSELAIARWQRLLEQDIPRPMEAIVRSRLAVLGATPQPSATGGRAPTLALTLTIAPKLAARVQQGETLFVFVRSPAGGPPLAVRRVRVKGFPVHVTLDDGDAMLAGRNLSSVTGRMVIVGAFISASGKATPRPGAPAGSRQIKLQPGEQTLELELARPDGD